jgi:hypothetical protein
VKSPDQIVDDIRRRLDRSWHQHAITSVTGRPLLAPNGPAGTDSGVEAAEERVDDGSIASWTFPLGSPSKSQLELEFPAVQKWAHIWRDTLVGWGAGSGATLDIETRMVHGLRQPLPKRLRFIDVDAAAAVTGAGWPAKLARGRRRAIDLDRRFPQLATTGGLLASVVRQSGDMTDTEFDLLLTAGDWFAENDATGLTPRQVPLPGFHAKWLNTRHALIATLAGRTTLGLRPPHPARLHYTYLDPDHLAAGGRRYDSATVGDLGVPAYRPQVVIITENKDTAICFPAISGGIAVEGEGAGAVTAAAFDWIRCADLLVYWGDMDADGLEILHQHREQGLLVVSILMDIATYDTYERFGTFTDAKGLELGCKPRRELPKLACDELELYQRLTDPRWSRTRRIEQERIPLAVALSAVQLLLDRR